MSAADVPSTTDFAALARYIKHWARELGFANTGISGAVDPYGRVLERTPIFETTTAMVDVRLLDGRTIYSYIGDAVAFVSAAIMAAVVALTFRWRRRV